MIGHAMPAAGMAGVIKTALALYHRVLPPTPHAENPHPLLAGPTSTFGLNPVARPWIHADEETPRRAGVNAFGLRRDQCPRRARGAHPLRRRRSTRRPSPLGQRGDPFLGPRCAGLIEQVRERLSWLKGNSRQALLDVAYSLNSLREHPPGGARLGVVASSLPELTERLTSALPRLADPDCRSIRDGRGIYYWDEPLLKGGPGAWLSSSREKGRNIPDARRSLLSFSRSSQHVRHGRPDRSRPR